MKQHGDWWKMPVDDLERFMYSVAANQLERKDLKDIIYDLIYRVRELQRSVSKL